MGNPIPSRDARQAAADILDAVSNLLDHTGIGQVADLIRDGEYDEHEATAIAARFEALIRADAYEQAANIVGPREGGEYSWLANRIRARALSDQPESTNEGLAELLRHTIADGYARFYPTAQGRTITLTATIAYPGSRVSDLKIGGEVVKLQNGSILSALSTGRQA